MIIICGLSGLFLKLHNAQGSSFVNVIMTKLYKVLAAVKFNSSSAMMT